MALDLFKLIEDNDAEGPKPEILQKIEESLKKVCVVFPEVVRSR